MSKSYFEVEFEGNFDTITLFLKEKVSCTAYPLDNKKLLIEINSDDKDELMFFKYTPAQDSISKIFDVSIFKRNKNLNKFYRILKFLFFNLRLKVILIVNKSKILILYLLY